MKIGQMQINMALVLVIEHLHSNKVPNNKTTVLQSDKHE